MKLLLRLIHPLVRALERLGRLLRHHPRSFAVLLVSLVFTVFSWRTARLVMDVHAQTRFRDEAREAELWIRNRVDLYTSALYSAAGFFAGSQHVERGEWADYVRREGLNVRHPGVTATGFIEYVPAAAKEEFVRTVREDASLEAGGYPGFRIHPEGERPEYLVVKYVEPFRPNQSLFGFDVAFDPRRWSAIQKAFETGEASATQRVDFGREDGGAVIEIYLPVYRRGAPAGTARERKEALEGFVYSALHLDSLFAGVFSEKRKRPAIDFQVYDGEVLSEENLLYAGTGYLKSAGFDTRPRFTTDSVIHVAGRMWGLRFVSLPGFGLEFPQELLPLLVLLGGLSGSALLFTIAYLLGVSRARALKLAELAALVEFSDDAIIGLDLEGRVASWNPAAQRIYGYTPPEMLGRSLAVLEAPDRPKELMDLLVRIRRGESISYYETVRLRKDGRRVRVLLTVSPVRDERGVLKGISTIDRDITQLKEVGELLQRSRDFYLTLFEEFPVMIWRSRVDGSRDYFNKTWLDFTGRTLEQERGEGWAGRLHAEDAGRYLAVVKRAHETEVSYEIEYRLRRNDDQARWIAERGQPFRGMDGRFSGFIGACYDVTDRKKAEQDLRHGLDLLFAIVENIPNMIFLKEAGELRFELFNRAGEELLGISRQEMIGKNDYDLFPREQADFFTRNDYEVLGQKKMKDIPEETIQTRDKGERVLHTKKVPILQDARGNPMYLLGISEDITERVQNERKLRDAFAGLEKAHAELKSAQSQLILAEKFAAMGKIAGIVSHEFRNQLGVIRNSAYFLKMKLRTEDEKIRNHLDILEKEIQETDRIVENILSFARRNEPAFQPVDLRRVLAASVERASAPPGIRLVTKVRGDLPLIQGDEVLLGRVFVNVILNAIQAMKDSGRLTVQAARAGSFIQVEIEDTGPGIKEEDKERVFDPLFSTKTHGTGLGLATARAIAEAHGGTIELESHFGRGTKVVVRLPAPPEAAAGKPGRA